jgi:hypothetical protein
MNSSTIFYIRTCFQNMNGHSSRCFAFQNVLVTFFLPWCLTTTQQVPIGVTMCVYIIHIPWCLASTWLTSIGSQKNLQDTLSFTPCNSLGCRHYQNCVPLGITLHFLPNGFEDHMWKEMHKMPSELHHASLRHEWSWDWDTAQFFTYMSRDAKGIDVVKWMW